MDSNSDIRKQIKNIKRQIALLDSKRDALAELLKQLEASLAKNETTASTNKRPINIDLYLSLFHGRKDVFARRWVNRKGRSGYSPACANEWVDGICGKPSVKCSECTHREFIPVTEEIVRRHLEGEITAGVYPLLQDETCNFIAIDFDKKSWGEDFSALMKVCYGKDVPVAGERSRSGNGAHAWFFFEEAVPAGIARNFGTALLTEAMDYRPQMGLDSYDRMFPNQNTMPKGGFGNLIALPLQGRAAENGNTVFLNEDLKPYPDQWAYLETIKRISMNQVRNITWNAHQRRKIIGVKRTAEEENEPWELSLGGAGKIESAIPDLPETARVILAGMIYIEKKNLPSAFINRIIRIAAFQNPEFYRAQAMRLSTWNKPRIISCAEDHLKFIAIPRGCFDELRKIFSYHGVNMEIQNKNYEGKEIDVSFTGTLREGQREAVEKLLSNDIGVLSAPTAYGKTVLAASLIARRKRNTVVLVHRTQLMNQWCEKLLIFLDAAEESIGRFGGGRKNRTGFIDIAMLQSLVRKGVVKDIVTEYGQVIVDECHHIPAFSFESVLRKARARYVTGLTATPTRKDGHHPIINMQCGPIRYRVSEKEIRRQSDVSHRVIIRETSTAWSGDEKPSIHDLYNLIMEDDQRNGIIAEDIGKCLEKGKTPLILTERQRHLRILAEEIKRMTDNLIVLHGRLGRKKRREAMEKLRALPDDAERAILSTGRYIGEGFDDSRLDTLFLTMPVSWKGTIQQYAGRLHRRHHSKDEVIIYDYVDTGIAMARRMFKRRRRGYASIGYTVS